MLCVEVKCNIFNITIIKDQSVNNSSFHQPPVQTYMCYCFRLMSVEEELKKDHSDMQSIVDSKQKIIEAQVSAWCIGEMCWLYQQLHFRNCEYTVFTEILYTQLYSVSLRS